MKRTYLILSLSALLLALALVACGPAISPEEAPTYTAEAEAAATEEAATEELAAQETAAAAGVDEESGVENTESSSEAQSPESQVPQEGAGDFDVFAGAGEEAFSTTESGLSYLLFDEGDGAMPEAGEVVSVHYTGYLEDGTVFDSSIESGVPIQFALGRGMVIPGWDEGISLMHVGDKGRLVIPSDLAYGDAGAGGVIPPNATLIFDVELVDAQPGAPEDPVEVAESDYITTDSGLRYYDIVEGDGASPEAGQIVVIHYTGWLEDGTQFDSSLNRGQPVSFPIGSGQVIPGWEEGMATMKIGGKRQLVIPPDLAFGEAGAGGGFIPPNATIILELELVGLE